MKVLSVSLISKKGVSAVTLSDKGYLIDKVVYKIHDSSILDSSYLCLIGTFITALRLTRKVLDKDSEYSRVVFEVNNTTFIKWVNLGYSKDSYQDKFFEALTLLNELPVEYKFTYSKVPFASRYLSRGIDKVQLTSLLETEEVSDSIENSTVKNIDFGFPYGSNGVFVEEPSENIRKAEDLRAEYFRRI